MRMRTTRGFDRLSVSVAAPVRSALRTVTIGLLLVGLAACSPSPPDAGDQIGRSDEPAYAAPRDDAREQPEPTATERAAADAAEPSPSQSPPVARESAELPEAAFPESAPEPAASGTDLAVNVMTFNIRYETPQDGEDRWELRAAHAIDVMRRDRPDFLGLQEVLPAQRRQIAQAMPEWGMIARGRGRTADRGESAPILYLRDRWRLDDAEQGFFWLSETPDVVGSQGWDAALPRLVTFGRFVERSTGRAVYVFNTHFDHRGATARQRSAALLAERVAAVADRAPVIVMGDFNVGIDGSVMAPLRRIGLVHSLRAYRTAHPDDIPPGASGTYHGFTGRPRSAIIDAIFVPEGSVIEHAEIIMESREGRYPSDHFPVTLRARLRAGQ